MLGLAGKTGRQLSTLALKVTLQLAFEAEPKSRRRTVVNRQGNGQQKREEILVLKEGKRRKGMIKVKSDQNENHEMKYQNGKTKSRKTMVWKRRK
jgi:hypothetical protein